MRKLLAILSCILWLTACNTVNGIGKDIGKAGEAIEKSSK